MMNRVLFSGKTCCENVRQILGWNTIKNNSNIVCVAKMIYNGEEYWAVNGVKTDETKNIKALKTIISGLDNDHICKSYKKKANTEARYYHPEQIGTGINWKVISYSQYCNVVKTKGIDENARLFSCCERKLISILRNNCDSFKMYVAFPPCYMCENAFIYLIDIGNSNFEVHYSDTPDDDETKFVNHLKQTKLI